MAGKYIIGVDTGGTFTDAIVIGARGDTYIGKALSTPPDFAEGVVNSLKEGAKQAKQPLSEILKNCLLFNHGSTAATNAVVTWHGARTGLITTRGHKGVMAIQRAYGRVVGLSDDEVKHILATEKPRAIVPYHLIEEVTERVDFQGEVLVPLSEAEVYAAIERYKKEGIEAVAVCLLWSFMNPTHERRIREIIQEMAPEMRVTLSSDLVPVLGEFERMSSTVVNAFLSVTVGRYYSALARTLRDEGLNARPLIVQSSGGVLPIEDASERGIHSIASGPVAGLIGAQSLGALMGYKNIICTDVGGTTFDVGLILEGRPQMAMEPSVGQYPLAIPMVDVTSIGAGGGSICWVDDHKIMHVGPDSAGANPGPACYGRGGTEPTVTDANLVLGYLDADYFLGGTMKLDKDKAFKAVEERLAHPLKIDPVEAAAGVYDIVNANMANAIRVLTVQRGHDPREMVLFAYGGAGPIHAAEYGADLNAPLIIVPTTASIFSAFGATRMEILHKYELSRKMVFPLDPKNVNEIFAELEDRARRDLEKDGVAKPAQQLRREVDMRYVLQVHEVSVPVPSKSLTQADLEKLGKVFFQLYEKLYGKGTALADAGMEAVLFRVDAIGKIPKPPLRRQAVVSGRAKPARKDLRNVYFRQVKPCAGRRASRRGGKFVPTPVFDGPSLATGNRVQGPAIVDYPTTTIVIPPERTAEVDPYMNVLIK
ncbi:MAG: hydantoinase/oxoprolinase family protein [Deltaproteobacteria bacterium]|nr:hydantoinase/oxoprolinase family protein [Deltaproteobacteria bacterium]